MIDQRIFNLVKSLVNIDDLVQRGHTAGFILEAIQVACKRQNRECTLSEMDIIGVMKMLELSQTQPFLPNTDIQTIDNVGNSIAETQPQITIDPNTAPQAT
ncbi:hypothetical protein [Salinivibrio sp. AR640]|uniref:hypothetical protein n=1 Tax=Salinivibrio sp. AR640 TaxID=1909437 RepID=UPI00098490B2|nr:hypothetical protein [Salinivibrio sp. AR640]OOE91594.1 hypothetical protein BZG75_10720 [Salinivibrio sp. AR640]